MRHALSRRSGLAMATSLTVGLLTVHPAHAQDASQLAAIQSQIASLQAQLKKLQRESAARDAELHHAQSDAAQARAEVQSMRRPTYASAPPGGELSSPPGYEARPAPASGFALGTPNPNATSLQGASPPSITSTAVDKSKPTFAVGGMTITLGGFLDTTILTRSRDLTAGSSTSFNSIPYDNSPNAHIDEFRFSSQYSRFSALIQGAPSPNLTMGGYFEGDLAGAATTANSTQTNSYTPRVRQAFASIDDTIDGLHLLVGQAYTMATGSTIGITARKESLPPGIDGNNLVGFTYLRQPQIRLVKDFGSKFWLGASLESPQETYAFSGATATAGSPNLTLPSGESLTYQNTGGSFLNSTANYSYDVAPDMIVKAAADLSFGHFEVYGLGRFFKSRTAEAGVGANHTTFGGGVGGSMVVPVFPKKLDLVGNVLAGDGVGRYMPGQLPDATFNAQGEPVALQEIGGMVGLVGHPIKAVDMYGFVGEETERGSNFSVTSKGKTTGYGYGSPFLNDSTCDVESVLATCSAQTRELADLSFGGWWRVLHGSYGTVQVGAQYIYVKKIAFSGIGGRPETDDNIGFVSLRFLPFQ